MYLRTVAHIGTAFEIAMGSTLVKQALPSQSVSDLDPFLLLHHFGPYLIEDGFDPLDVAPHPHRGFEPVTFLYQGAIQHHDSRGNSGLLEAGDVQWMTSGLGIIHSERAAKDFLARGGVLEGIQLWVNLPAQYKMVQPRYQQLASQHIPSLALGKSSQLKVVAGSFGELKGLLKTYTAINAWQIDLAAGDELTLPIPQTHTACIYLLDGHLRLNQRFDYQGPLLISFRQDGEGIELSGMAPQTRLLLLSGKATGEPIVQYGPFVMNTQTEVLEAMRDYKMGKMGFYVEP